MLLSEEELCKERDVCVREGGEDCNICKSFITSYTLNSDGGLNLGDLWKTDK